jgi:hypothetical protein
MENEENVPIKRKKGRPRKTDIKDKIPVIQEKKKRGRKKKEKPIEEPKQKKKRGRKAAVKYFSSSIRKKIPLTTILEDNESNILHLEMNENEVESEVENNEFSLQSAQDLIKQYKEIRTTIENENKILENYISDSTTINKHIDLVENENDISELLENRLNIREKQDTIIKKTFESIRKHEITTNNKKSHSIDVNSDEEKRKLGYFNVLNTFYENEEWLHQTDICCWWCCHQFDSVPIGYPIKYIEKINKFRSRGIFCSFPCMVAYSKEQKSENKDLIKYLFYKLTGLNTFSSNLNPAPPRCALKMFGGMLDIDEFRNSIPNKKIYQMIEYPMIIARDYIQEVDLERIKTVNNTVFNTNDFSRINKLSEKQVEDAKTRVSNHNKNTITTGNTIDKFLKFS